MIYLDNAATTDVRGGCSLLAELHNEGIDLPIDKSRLWMNSNSPYSNGDEIVHLCKVELGKAIGCNWDEIIITSGGCEGNTMCINALYNMLNRCVLVSRVEHKSVMKNPKTIASCNPEWHMMVNNETGEEFDVKGMLGTDCVQALGKKYINVKELGVKCATFSGHKIHSHKGIGFIYMDKELQKYATPIIYGGQQEFGLRGGTTNLESLVHMTERVMYCNKHLAEHQAYIVALRTKLFSEMRRLDINYKINHVNFFSPIISLQLPMNGNYIVNRLAEKGIYISTGSACSTGEPSYVLKNMGLTNDECDATIRVSLDTEVNSMDDIKTFVAELKNILEEY